MLTLVDIQRSATSSADTSSLIADYLAFDRQRASRRQYTKAFGGMAILVLLGGLFNRVPGREALIAAGLLLVVPVSLSVVEALRWFRLVRRLDELRIQTQEARKS